MASILINAPEGTEVATTFKIVLVGDSGVGKTNLLGSAEGISQGSGPDAHDVDATRATVGVEFASIIFVMKDGTKIKAQIWDTAGQERYRAITRSHYRRAAGAMLIYDSTDPGSLKNAQDVWLPELISSAEDEATMRQCIMLVGNKTDLPSSQQVSSEVHDACQQDMGVDLSQRTSARTGDGVEAAFGELVQRVYELRTQETSKNGSGGSSKRNLFRKSSTSSGGTKSSCC